MSAEKLKLSLFSHSTFPTPVSATLIASSPSLNLVATVTNDNTLAIRRACGELVSSSSERGRSIQALCWKADAWDDGNIGLLSVENTKVVHRIAIKDGDAQLAPITYIAWAQNLTGKRHFSYNGDKASKLRGLIQDELALDGARGISDLVDLPHALTFLEIDTSLPKISPLPVSGGTGDDMFAFSTNVSLESVFAPPRVEDNDVVDVMVAATRDGDVHLSIYDSFPIGIFKVPIKTGPSPSSSQKLDGMFELCLHASHPEVSTHALLMRPGGEKGKALYLVPMDLRFVSYSPVNLSLLASKTTTLQKLLRYMLQTQAHIRNEWQSTRELPRRFLNIVQEDLASMKSGPTDIFQALYHTVLTGHVYQPVRDWLVDSIGDRGHKRWDKAVIPGLEAVRNLIHENMLPAMERVTLILSRLSGIARFHEEDDQIGFTNAEITRLVDILSALTLVYNRVLLIVIEELELFRVFSSWVRITIDRVSTSNPSDEIMEKEALLDPAKILRYIERYLVRSPMATFLDTAGDFGNTRHDLEDSTNVLDEVDEQLKLDDEGKPFRRTIPQVNLLFKLLVDKAGDIFKNIAEAEKRSVRFGQAVKLDLAGDASGPETPGSVDMTMLSLHKPNGVDGIVYTAVLSKERPHTVNIFEIKIEIINGISSAPTVSHAQLDLDLSHTALLLDLKFLNDKVLLLLCQEEGRPPHLIYIPFRQASVTTQDLVFPEDLSAFAPVQMEVLSPNDSKAGVPARIALLGKDLAHSKVFALRGNIELSAS
ncbi:hypothetical protein N0V82_000998 [Gnomoniopsis sp. IMI 355080]|nr:hypothetical protein N0V82_000998 [Gnomoniopsis sp. IMI 355080]